MKKLFILRHAKANPDADYDDDHDKPLSIRGHSDSKLIAKHIKSKHSLPDLILSSDSLRTKQTTNNMLATFGSNTPVHYTYNLYLASPGEILKEIGHCQDSISTILIIGHNPGVHQLSSILTGGGNVEHIKNLQIKFPTSAIALFSLTHSSWKAIEPGTGILEEFVTPRMLKKQVEEVS